MTSWQKRARAFVAVVAIGVIAVVAYTMRPRESAAPPAPIEKIDPNEKIVTVGGNAIQLKGAQQDLKIEFGRQATYQDGQTRLFDVKVLASNRGGRSYTITGKEAQVGKDESSFEIKGDVKLETSDGLIAHSAEATYADADKIVRAPGPVKFSRGRMTGTGEGFNFDEQRDALMILANADVHFAPEGQEGPMDVKAGAFTYARRDRYMLFQNTVHMDRGGQLMDADNSTVRLYPDRDETDLIELRGNSRVTGGGAMGNLQALSATDINLKYGTDGRTLEHATLAGHAVIDLVPTAGGTGQKLAGELMDIALAPDGTVRNLAARNAVEVTLPATKDTSARTIRAPSLTAIGNPQGLRSMKFDEKVEYREAATKTQNARVVRARTLEADLESATGALAQAHFIGAVDFTDGPMHATSVDAVYNVAKGTLALTGKEPRPHLENDVLTIDANTIDVTLDPRTMTADGRVSSTMLPTKQPAGAAAAQKRPGLLGEKEPVQIVADKLTYHEATRVADYSGKVTLLQGETTIQGDALTLDETKGDMTAKGKVVTTLAIVEKDAPAGVKAKPMLGRAGSFTYADQTRTATYTTTAQLDGDQGNLRATKIDLKLAKAGNTMEGLEADGQVIALVDRRTVTGARLSYSPTDDKYIVTGAPVRMVDADCQETLGKTLTFWKASDRVQVDGNNEVRTQTKGGGKCPQTPPQ
jgi:lipopolysaccharide transport protein LptA